MGISAALARERRRRVSDLQCQLALSLPVGSTAVSGRFQATFTLQDSGPLAFDFDQPAGRLADVRCNERLVTPAWDAEGHPVIPGRHLSPGRNDVSFTFFAGEGALHQSGECRYSLFVPARACRAFPCFDQPDLKARWQISACVPAGWTAVSNAPERSHQREGEGVRIAFAETHPLPTYLVAIAAGPLRHATCSHRGRLFGIVHAEPDGDRLDRNIAAILDAHSRSLDWLEDYTAIPHPFAKLDIVLVPSFQFSGMEHPGAIYYDAAALLLDETATTRERLARSHLIAHEVSHLWFGDLVTMPWFDDVWLKEVFANHFARAIVDAAHPSATADLRFFLQHYRPAYDLDRSEGRAAIRQPLLDLADAGSLYGASVYHKAPIVLRHLEHRVGGAALRASLREYLRTFAYGSAGWPDLLRILEARSGARVGVWSASWIDSPGRPAISSEVAASEPAGFLATVRQARAGGDDPAWPQTLHVAVGTGGVETTHRVELSAPSPRAGELRHEEAAAIAVHTGARPDWVLPGGLGWGYARFDVDDATIQSLIHTLHEIANPLTRAVGLETLWDAMAIGRIPGDAMLPTLTAALAHEENDLLLERLLDDVRTVFWRFATPAGRAAAAPSLEPRLWARLDAAPDTRGALPWLRTLRRVATLDTTIERLERIWRREELVGHARLPEADEADLACELAVRLGGASDSLVDTQINRAVRPDRRGRLTFLRPALVGDGAIRLTFIDELCGSVGLVPEPWLLDGLRWLQHPARPDITSAVVPRALSALEAMKAAGDIFLPARWIQSSLASSPVTAAADSVRGFLASVGPGYPADLRRLLLAHVTA